MKLAVTGCQGSIGKRVVRYALNVGHTVIGLDISCSAKSENLSNPSFTLLQVDLTDYEATINGLKGCDAVIQLAGVPHPADYRAHAHNTNVVITWNVLRAVAELGIKRVAQASSVNVVTMVFSEKPKFDYFPIDELHPCLPDEPYGLSKLICEMQADTIARRYPTIRIASLRLHYSVPDRTVAVSARDTDLASKDLWGWLQEDSAAEAFILAISEDTKWSGHERIQIVSETIDRNVEDSKKLKEKYWPDVPVTVGKVISGEGGFFDCSKARRILGWAHRATGRELEESISSY